MSQPTTSATRPAGQQSTPEQRRNMRRVVVGAGIGNVLEWYDFTVYAYLATILASKFFASGNDTAALLSTFAVFGVGFVARPIGGILIGIFGDKYGRKPTLLLTFSMIAASTALIGLLPTYATIGVAAPVLLVVARLVQGASAGGEWGGSASFLVEWAPEGRKGLFGSFHPAGICFGQLLGAAVTGFLFLTLGQAVMEDWGWRIPFLLGALIGPFGFWIRRRLDETPAFQEARAEVERDKAAGTQPEAETKAARQVLDTDDADTPALSRGIALAFAFPVLQSVLTYLFLSYFPTYGEQYLGLSATQALWSTVAATVVMGLTSIASGFLSDRFGRRPMLLSACALAFVLAVPLLAGVLAGVPVVVVVAAHMMFSIVNGLFLGAMPSALVELFATKRRMFGLTTGYNLQSMIFGGFAPFIAASLIAITGAPLSIAFFIMAAALLSAIAVIIMKETAHRKLS